MISCGTCGGTRELTFDPAEGTPFSGGMYVESEPCPDCGVETPEAAVEALVLVDRQHERYTITQPPIKLVCKCGWRASVGPRTLDVQWRLHVMAQLLAALRAQGWIPPGGTE